MILSNGNAREVFRAPSTTVSAFAWPDIANYFCSSFCAAGLPEGDNALDQAAAPLPPLRPAEKLPTGAGRSVGSREEARHLVTQFCQDVSSTGSRIAPGSAQLVYLWGSLDSWLSCEGIGRKAVVVDAFLENFLEGPWQVQQRCLRGMLFFHGRGAKGREVASAFVDKARVSVKRMACAEGVPCRKEAAKLLAVVRAQDAILADDVLLNMVASSPAREAEQESSLPGHPDVGSLAPGAGRLDETSTEEVPCADLLGVESSPLAGRSLDPVVRGAFQSQRDETSLCEGGQAVSMESAEPPAAAMLGRTSVVQASEMSLGTLEEQEALAELFVSKRLSAEVFDIGGGEAAQENADLDKMFSFKTHRRTYDVPVIPLLSPTHQVFEDRADPFDFVNAHLVSARGATGGV